MKYQTKAIEVEGVKYQKDLGLEDGYAVYETEYPEDGHTFELSENVDTTRQTIIQAAIQTPAWKVVSEGEWIVTYPDGVKSILEDEEFQKRFAPCEPSAEFGTFAAHQPGYDKFKESGKLEDYAYQSLVHMQNASHQLSWALTVLDHADIPTGLRDEVKKFAQQTSLNSNELQERLRAYKK